MMKSKRPLSFLIVASLSIAFVLPIIDAGQCIPIRRVFG